MMGAKGRPVPDYGKIDAMLAAALEEEADPARRVLSVFIHTTAPLSDEEVDYLASLGVRSPSRYRRIYTATLSPAEVADLSAQPWVAYVRLSQRRRLYPPPASLDDSPQADDPQEQSSEGET